MTHYTNTGNPVDFPAATSKASALIEELAEESGITQYVAAHNKYLERFAQLIIRQCIVAVSDPGDGLILDDTWHDGIRAAVWSIQDEFALDRNFGVKE